MPPPPARRGRSPRPLYLAAPPLLAEGEAVEGAALLGEHPPAAAALLWKTLRDLTAWTETAPADRPALFPAGAAATREAEVAAAALEAELWAPLLVVARLADAPAAPDLARLVHACRALARWAGARGRPATQLAFTQAAARLAPEHARLAYAVGRLARDRGEYARAESWLRRAVRLARGRDWHAYALSYLSLGTLYQQLGNLPAARALTLRGTRTARRRRMRGLEGTGCHNLFVLASEAGEYEQAQELAAAALECYGTRHPRLPALAYDLGCLWFLCGHFERALAVFEAVLPRMTDSPERTMGHANAARAAAGAGDRVRFHRFWDEAEAGAERHGVHARVAEAWMSLAYAADALGERARTVRAVERATAVARVLRLSQVIVEADALEAAVERLPAAPRTPSVPRPELSRRAASLAEQVVAQLAAAAV